MADARRIAELQRELAEAKSQQATGAPAFGVTRPGYQRSFGAAPVDTHLADAPRRVPIRFLLAELLPFRWWYVFAMFMLAVAPISLWISEPALVAPAAVATLFVIYGYQCWTARKRLGLLQWGRVATVTGSELLARGTYYSGTTWSNVWLPQAHGWTVTRNLWSGPNTKTRVSYTLDGYHGALELSGRAYDDGVVLADQRAPARASCVSSFAYDLDRDESGNWTGRLRTRLKLGMVVWAIIVIAWLAAGVGVSTGIAKDLFATRLDHGGTGSVRRRQHGLLQRRQPHHRWNRLRGHGARPLRLTARVRNQRRRDRRFSRQRHDVRHRQPRRLSLGSPQDRKPWKRGSRLR